MIGKQAVLLMWITLKSIPGNNQYWAMRVWFLAQERWRRRRSSRKWQEPLIWALTHAW